MVTRRGADRFNLDVEPLNCRPLALFLTRPERPSFVGCCETAAVEPSPVLSDGTIRRLVAEGHLGIDPWDPSMVQPASVDLKLGPSFRVFHNHRIQTIDLAAPPRDLTEHVEVADGE